MGTIKTTNIETITGSGTLTLGQSGETVSIPTNTTLGASGTTITVPSGCTITNNGTQTGFGESNSPYFRAYMGGTNTLNNNVTTKVVYDTVSWNVGGTYSTGSSRWTPGVQGRYLINAQVTMNWSDSAGDRIDLLIRKNGSNVIYRRLKSGGSFGGNESSILLSGTVDLDSDDYVEAFCEQDSGSSRTYSGGNEYNYWEGFLISTY
jgi:hypothetical protein